MTRKTDQPTALDLPPVDPLPETTARYFEICEEKLGLVPNVLRAHAFDIEKLDAFTALYNTLMLAPSGLSKLEREMIAVVVSSINRCWYCQVAHGAAVRALSDDPALGEAMVMNYRVADLEPRQRAMLDFAAIWDIANVAGFFNMSNRVASATGMEPNPDYHSQAR